MSRPKSKLAERHGLPKDVRVQEPKVKELGIERAEWYLSRGLNPQEALFVENYFQNGCNQVQAYIAAGYETLSRKSMSGNAYKLRMKPHISKAIADRLAEVMVPTNEVISKVMSRINYSMDDFITVDEDGKYRLDLIKAKETGAMVILKKLTNGQFGTNIEVRDQGDDIDRLANILNVYKREISLAVKEDPIAIFTRWTKTPAPDEPKK